jgi:hypothetical protein
VQSRGSRRALFATLVAAAASLGPAGSGAADPGVLLELDRARFALSAHDERSGDEGPLLRVAVGAPSTPTPRGQFGLERVILNPAWHPGATARAFGARPMAPSLDSPMGVAKLPFAAGGEITLHGGGDPDLLGKPISAGCVRAADADLLRLLAWLDRHDALGPPRPLEGGEVLRAFERPVRLVVR